MKIKMNNVESRSIKHDYQFIEGDKNVTADEVSRNNLYSPIM